MRKKIDRFAIHSKNTVKLFLAHLFHRLGQMGDASIVHKNIHLTKDLSRGRDSRSNISRHSHIRHMSKRPRPKLFGHAHGSIVVDIHNHHLRALCRKLPRNPCAKAARAARDNRCFSLKSHRVFSLFAHRQNQERLMARLGLHLHHNI